MHYSAQKITTNVIFKIRSKSSRYRLRVLGESSARILRTTQHNLEASDVSKLLTLFSINFHFDWAGKLDSFLSKFVLK